VSAELLLREFDRAAEAPDAMDRVRGFVVAVATRGDSRNSCRPSDRLRKL